jgi:aconitate decarboxylase
MAVTAQLCERIAGTDYENLGPPAIEAARRLVLDGIAIAIAGTEEEAIHILAAHRREQGGLTQATAIGNGFRLNTASAAALNGAAMHVLDFEPMWSPANHALSTTLAGVLALAEARGTTGREILTALVKGVEMQGWIRQASGQYEASTSRFHPPGAVGPLGAAVAAGHLLKLDPDQLANAIGIAASRAGSLLANAGTMTKSTHCGHAAALGLESALFAARGFTANVAVFEAAQGYVPAFYDDGFKVDEMLGFGRAPFRIVDPGYAIKMFPSQFGTHFGIIAGLDLHPKIPAAAAIRRVVLTAPVMNYVNRPLPKTGLEGKFSLQYTAASALTARSEFAPSPTRGSPRPTCRICSASSTSASTPRSPAVSRTCMCCCGSSSTTDACSRRAATARAANGARRRSARRSISLRSATVWRRGSNRLWPNASSGSPGMSTISTLPACATSCTWPAASPAPPIKRLKSWSG